MKPVKVFLTFCGFFSVTSALKVLAVFPVPTYSHFVIGDVLTKELASRGHDVTVIAPFKQKTTMKNRKLIEMVGVKELMEELKKSMNFFELQNANTFLSSFIVPEIGYDMTKLFYENENVQKLIKSGGNYDLIIIEHFYNEAAYGLCNLFKAPCVAVCGVGAMNWINRLTGNIGMASYVPHLVTNYSPRMSFFERFHNLMLMVFEEVFFHMYYVPKMERLLHQHIPNAPPLYDLIHNISMVFLNSHPALSAPVPLTPNMLELPGIHVEGLKHVKLPSDLQSFLDNHSEGVIYFALGSNAKSKDMPEGALGEIIGGLKKWGKPVLWKYEEDLPETIENIMVDKWFPQTAVLAHKNVVAFITHCGRLSSLESLYYGVPMVGLPLFGEQARNAAEMVSYGYAIALDLQTLKAEAVYEALVEITENPRYSEEARIRSKALRKRNALDEAVYWIEHVAEFKGASYLRNAGVDLPWYQFWMVDVIGLLVISFVGLSGALVYLVLKALGRRSKVNKRREVVSRPKKKN